jgi:hypothetical protein
VTDHLSRVCAALALFAPLVLLAPMAAGGATGRAPHRASSESNAGNLQAAERDVEERLATFSPPPGAKSAAGKPAGTDSELNGPPQEPETPNLVDRGAWWTVPSSPAEVLAWSRANPPVGTSLGAAGTGVNGQSGTEFQYVEIRWPSLPGVDERVDLVAATALPGGGTALRVDSQAVWVVPRPPSERIPVAARLLEVQWHPPKGHDVIESTSNARFVKSLAALLDGLPIGQPGIRTCPAMFADPPTVTLRFRARQGGPILAEAFQDLPPGACNGMSLTIGGRGQPVLVGAGPVIRRLRKLR